MKILPVVGRELIAASRNRQIYRTRFLAAVAAVAAMVWVVLFGSGGAGFALLGKTLFQFLAYTAFGFCLIGGLLTADSISFEKREGTLGLLFLTNLRGYDVIFGKLAASGLGAVYAILGLMPVLSMTLLLGAVQWLDVLRVGIVWLNTLFVSMTLGITISTLSVNSRRATFGFVGVILGMVFLPYGIAFWQADMNGSGIFRIGPEFIVFSPFRALELALNATGTGGRTSLWLEPDFQTSLILPHVFAWAAAGIASVILPSLSRDRSKSRVEQIVAKKVDKWSYGEGGQRSRRRAELLDENAYLWLCARHQKKRGYVWFFLGSMALIWVVAGINFPVFIFSWSICFVLLFGVHAGLKIWWTAEVCTQLTDDRRSGALELLLTTPLGTEEMVQGHQLALRRMFGRPVMVLLLLEAILCLHMIRSPETNSSETWLVWLSIGGGAALLLCDAWALRWVGLWKSLAGKSAQHAINGTAWKVLVQPTLILIVLTFSTAFFSSLVLSKDWDKPGLFFGTWIGLGCCTDLWLGLRAKNAFLRRLRPTASGDKEEAPTASKVQQAPTEPARVAPRSVWKRHPFKLGFASLVALVVAACVANQQWWDWKAGKILKQLSAAGHPTNAREWEKLRPHRSSETNSYTFLLGGTKILKLPARSAGFHPILMEWDRRSPISSQTLQEIDSVLLANRDGRLMIERAIDGAFNASYGPEHVDAATGIWTDNFGNARDILRLASFSAIEEQAPGIAIEQIRRLFKLGELVGKLPSSGGMAAFASSACIHAGVDLLERLLTRSQLDENQLAKLESQIPDWTTPMLVLRWMEDDLYRFIRIRDDPSLLTPFLGWGGQALELQQIAMQAAKLSGIADRESYFYLQSWKTAMDSDESDGWNQILKTTVNPHLSRFPWFSWTWMLGNPNPASFGQLCANMATRLNSVRVGIEVERFRLRHNRLPSGIPELETRNIGLLVDPVSGNAMQIELTNPGYEISVGEVMEPKPVRRTQSRGGNRGRHEPVKTFTIER